MLLLWVLSKGCLGMLDVFYTFFTERPLFKTDPSTLVNISQNDRAGLKS